MNDPSDASQEAADDAVPDTNVEASETTSETEVGPEEMPTIRLDQFLKLTGIVGTGGQAKLMIQGGEVLVNGEVETRRRRQLVLDDVVDVAGEIFAVELE